MSTQANMIGGANAGIIQFPDACADFVRWTGKKPCKECTPAKRAKCFEADAMADQAYRETRR